MVLESLCIIAGVILGWFLRGTWEREEEKSAEDRAILREVREKVDFLMGEKGFVGEK